MTRRLAERPPRRLLRMRPAADRPEHGLDLALVAPRTPARDDPGAAQGADQRALRALAEENALLTRELGRVQARCTQWRDDCIVQAERLEGLLVRARGDLIARETQLAAQRDTLEALQQRAASWLTNEALVRRLGELRARNRTLEAALGALRRGGESIGAACDTVSTAPAADWPALPLRGRRVLCVGGRARQMPVYRELVERQGGCFDHVDGADPGRLPELRLALADADLVILQPGYACQGACRAVEQHCTRTAIQCVQLDKACVPGFERSLAEAVGAAWPALRTQRP